MASAHDAERMGTKPHWEPEDVIGKMTLSTLLFSDHYRHIAIKGTVSYTHLTLPTNREV